MKPMGRDQLMKPMGRDINFTILNPTEPDPILNRYHF